MATFPIRRSVRMVAGLAAGAAIVFGGVLPATLAHADVEDPIAGTVEMTLSAPVTVYTEPDPASAVAATLTPGTTVDKVGQQVGADKLIWVEIAQADGTVLGWIHLTDFLGGSPGTLTAGMFDGITLPPTSFLP